MLRPDDKLRDNQKYESIVETILGEIQDFMHYDFSDVPFKESEEKQLAFINENLRLLDKLYLECSTFLNGSLKNGCKWYEDEVIDHIMWNVDDVLESICNILFLDYDTPFYVPFYGDSLEKVRFVVKTREEVACMINYLEGMLDDLKNC